MSICNLALVLVLGFTLQAKGAWTIVSSKEASPPEAGCHHLEMSLRETESGDLITLHLARFDSKKTTLRIIDQPTEPRTTLAEVMQKEKCVAGVNGGYFEQDYGPVGLLVSGGRVIAPFRKARLLSGVLSATNGKVRLQRVTEFSRKAKVSEAVQSGPFLVDHAQTVVGLDDSRSARRTFAAMGKPNEIALGSCSTLSLAQLARVLVAVGKGSDFKIERVLNLDGGSSSAFWFANQDEPFSIAERKTVRDFVTIVPN